MEIPKSSRSTTNLYWISGTCHYCWWCVRVNVWVKGKESVCAERSGLNMCARCSSCVFAVLGVSLAWALDSHQPDTVWWHSAGRRWTSSGSCASQSGILQRQSVPSGSCHFQRQRSGGLCHNWLREGKSARFIRKESNWNIITEQNLCLQIWVT